MRRLLFGVTVGVLAEINSLQALPAFENKALAKKIGDIVCSGTLGLEPRKLLAAGIFEAQIAGRIYRKVDNKVIDEGVVRTQVKRDAETRKHLTYATGRCANGHAWSITAPTPTLSIKLEENDLSFDHSVASTHCQNLSLQFAAKSGRCPV